MKRWFTALLLPVAAAGLISAAGAAVTDPPFTPGERAWLFARDRELIQTLVNQGLRLADEDDPLKRADHCNGVARQLADEMQQAARQREPARVAELGRHLHAVLKRGVAANLTTACAAPVPPNSAFEKELRRVHEHTAEVLGPLEEQLRGLVDGDGPDELRATLQALAQGRLEVEKIVESRSKAKGKP